MKGCLDNINDPDRLRHGLVLGTVIGLFWALVALSANKLFMFIYKKPLIVQIKTFIRYRPQTILVDSHDEATLLVFAEMSKKNDISEITSEDRTRFHQYLNNTVSSGYERMRSMHVVDMLIRYYNFHTKVKAPKRLGRPLALDKQKNVFDLVDAGHTYREVQAKTGINISLVNRWMRLRNRMEAKESHL